MASARSRSILCLLEEALSAHRERFRTLEARAAAGGDEELVHDVRVALRRIEAVARLFRSVPGEGDGEAVREAARELRCRLSLLRSEEVGRALLAARAGGEGTGGLEAVLFPGALPAVRVDAADVSKVAAAIHGWRRRLASACDGPFAPRVEWEALLRRRTRRRLRRRLSDLISLLPPGRKKLHAARIAAKRVRYALEAVEPLDPDSRPLLRLLRSFQDAAGDAHDLAELARRVREAAWSTPAARTQAEALGAGLDADAARAASAARRRGLALSGPARRFRPTLDASETR